MPNPTAFSELRNLAREVVNSADNAGCTEDLTVVDADAVEALCVFLIRLDLAEPP